MEDDKINFEESKEELGIKVRAILGVPEEILTDDIIFSPIFRKKADIYINKKIQSYNTNTEEEMDLELVDKNLIHIAYLYYICYLLCPGMDARLPKQMENTSTKTVLQTIDWTSKALEMLDNCNSTIESAMEEFIEDIEIGNSFAVLTDSSEYPNTTI